MSRLPLPPLPDRVLVVVVAAAVVFRFTLPLLCSGCTWSKGRVGSALVRECIGVVDDAKGLLPVRVPMLMSACHNCHCYYHCGIAFQL